jgi:hypothetical protein
MGVQLWTLGEVEVETGIGVDPVREAEQTARLVSKLREIADELEASFAEDLGGSSV